MRGPLNIIKTPYTASSSGCLLGISLKFHMLHFQGGIIAAEHQSGRLGEYVPIS